ncbi:MAG: hypothetical protein QMD06_00160 [Candidatus Altarchaeum sp.]|nr:hypothetical protein [Candidatus Altarchaeum sp.]
MKPIMKPVKFLFILLVFLVFAINTVDAYSGLMGGEFVIRAVDMWGPDKSETTPSVISVVAFDNNTNIEVWTFEEDGSKLLVYNGTMHENEVIDFYDRGCLLGDATPRNYTTCISGTPTNPDNCNCRTNTTYTNIVPTKIFGKFVHIMLTGIDSTKRGYVFVVESEYNDDEIEKYRGYGGTLRSSPGRSGSFLDTSFVVHYPWRFVNDYHHPIFGIFYWKNKTVNVTITPIGLNGSVLSADVNGRSQYNCTLTGNGDPRYPAYCTLILSNTVWGRTPVSYRVDANDDVFVMQYNRHIDTLQWLSALDNGVLSGQVILSAGSQEHGGILFNTENYSVNVNIYRVHNYAGSDSNTYIANSVNNGFVTANPISPDNLFHIGNFTIPAHSSKMYTSSNPEGTTSADNVGQIILIMVNGSGLIEGMGGIGRNTNPLPHGWQALTHLSKPWDHVYTRVPPKIRNDTITRNEFGFSNTDRYTGSEGKYINTRDTAVSWDIYQLACIPLEVNSTKINVNHSETVCFNNTVTSASYPLNLQGYNSTVLFYNVTQPQIIVMCNGPLASITNTSNTIILRNCNNTRTGYNEILHNGSVTLINMSITANTSTTRTIVPTSSTFGFNITGKVQLYWNTTGKSCFDRFEMNASGLLSLGGTSGVTANGTQTDYGHISTGTTFGGPNYNSATILNLYSNAPFKLYRNGVSSCSNSPVEAVSPYIVLDSTIHPDVVIVNDKLNVTVTTINYGSTTAYSTMLTHIIEKEFDPNIENMEIYLNGLNIISNVTFNYSSGCVPTDLHTGNAINPAVVCVNRTYYTVGGYTYPYPKNTLYFAFGNMLATKTGFPGDNISFKYEAQLMDTTGTKSKSFPSYAIYQYCSPYISALQNTSVEVISTITIVNLYIKKSVVSNMTDEQLAALGSYPAGTIFNVTVEFGEGNNQTSLWLANVSIIDYYNIPVNLTYNGIQTNDSYGSGTDNAFYTRYNVSDSNNIIEMTGYNNTRINGTNSTPGGILHITFNYTNNNRSLGNISNVTHNIIKFQLIANGTVPQNLTNCVNITLKVCDNSSFTTCHNQIGQACITKIGQIRKTMDNGSCGSGCFYVGDIVNSTVTFNATLDNKFWMVFWFGDDMPAFFNYTGYAWLNCSISCPPSLPWFANNALNPIGKNNNPTYESQGIWEFVEPKPSQSILEVKWKMLNITNITNWQLIVQMQAIDQYNQTITNLTIQDRNYGFFRGTDNQSNEYSKASTPYEIILKYFPNATINKTVNQSTAQIGDYLNYTITVVNTGDGMLYNLTVNDTFPSGIQFISWNNYTNSTSNRIVTNYSQWLPQNYLWNMTNLSKGAIWQINFTVRVLSSAPELFNNTACLSGYDQNGMQVFQGCSNISTLVLRPSLNIEKTVGNNLEQITAEPGDDVNFTIVVTNNRTVNSYNIKIFDFLPPWFNYTKSWIVNSSGSYQIGEGNITKTTNLIQGLNITWNMSWYMNATLAPGKNFTIRMQVHVMSNASALENINTACVNGSDIFGNNSVYVCDTASVWVVKPFLTVEKKANATSAKPRDIVSYTITINNPSDATAKNINFCDHLQYGFILVSNASYIYSNSSSGTINASPLPPVGGTVCFYFDGILPKHTWIKIMYNTSVTSDAVCDDNIAEVSYTDKDNISQPNISARWEICPIIKPGFSVDKISNDSLIRPGQNSTFIIVITNYGIGTLYNVVVNDTLPDRWIYANNLINLTPNICNATYISDSNANFTIGNLSANSTCKFAFATRPNSSICYGEHINYVNVTGYDSNNTMLSAQAHSSVDVIYNYNVEIEKNIKNNKQKFEIGDMINFIIKIYNYGDTIDNASLKDYLPIGLIFDHCEGNSSPCSTSDSYNGDGEIVTIPLGIINTNTTKFVNISANITSFAPSGTNVNKVILYVNTSCGQFTKKDSKSFVIFKPTLKIVKTVNPNVTPGQNLTYNISISTNGVNAYNVTVTDIQFCNFIYSNPPNTSNSNVKWQENQKIFNITVPFNATTQNPFLFTYNYSIPENFCDALCFNQVILNGKYKNNENLEASHYTAYTYVRSKVFLNVTKEILNGYKFYNGSIIQFRINVSNTGINTLYNLTVEDIFPNRMLFNNAFPSNSSGSLNTILWNFDNITGGKTKNIYFNITVTDNTLEGAHTNYVKANAYRCGNTYEKHDQVEFEIITSPKIFIVKDASIYSVMPGDKVTFKIYFLNPSNINLYNASIQDYLPTGFKYIANSTMINGANYTTSTGKDANVTGNYTTRQNITWNLSMIYSKTFNVLTFETEVKCNITNSYFFNNASITASWINNTDVSNVNSNTSLKMQGNLATVKIYKRHSNNKPSFFDYVEYIVTIRNNASGGNVEGINLTDYIPNGLKYVNNSLRIGDITIYGTSNPNNGTRLMNLSDCETVNNNCIAVGTITGNYSVGTNITLNLTGYVFLKPWEQISVAYTVQVMPNTNSAISNNASITYIDPSNPHGTEYDAFDTLIILPPQVDDMTETNCTECSNTINFTRSENLTTFTFRLHAGWNLISIPVALSETSLFSVLKGIEYKYTEVFAYADDGWQFKVYINDKWIGNMDKIETGKGYWIYMEEDAIWIIEGYEISNVSIFLHEGWNLIGYPRLDSKNISQVMSWIDGKYTGIYAYDRSWEFRTYTYDVWLGSLDKMEPGRGYLIKMKNSTILKF